MDNAGRVLVIAVILAILTGVGIVLLDKDYRPKKIAETNRGIFSNIPVEAGGEPAGAEETHGGH